VGPGIVAGIVERPYEAAFVSQLRQANTEFQDAGFEAELSDVLRSEPRLCGLWATWSADQRWTPSAYVEGTETGWFDSARHHVRVHADEAAAVADFIHRMAAWLATGEVLTN
jgi:hypothetical protein